MGGLGHSGELSVSVAAHKPKGGWNGEGEREKESWVTLASNVGTAGTALCEAALVAQQHCVSVSWLDNEWHWGFVRDLSPLCTASLQCQC